MDDTTPGTNTGEQLAALVASMPFAVHTGVRITEASPERVTGELDWSPDRCTVAGMVHGAALMTLADSLGAVCAFLNLPEGASTSTVTSSTNFLRAVREGTVHATSAPIQVGGRFVVVRTELRDDEGRLVADVTQTQAVVRPR